MADDIRQQIMDEVIVRFQTITTANGYETGIGSNVKLWRDMNNVSFSKDNLDAINVKDIRSTASREETPLGTTLYDLEIHVEGTTNDTSMARDKRCRKMLADLVKAIGTDRKWTVSGTKLAWNTEVEQTAIDVAQKGEVYGGFQLVFHIFYRQLDFDPYTISH